MQQKLFKGLTDTQVVESRRLYGTNVLTPPAKEPVWKQFLHKFSDPLIIILLIAGALSVGISCYEYYGLGETAAVFFEPAGIFIAILLATGLAFYFEYAADKEFAILNQVNDDEMIDVVRNGYTTSVPRRDIVVGDVVILNTGAEIPADGELLKAIHMQVDESTLTGEPLCMKTTVESEFDAEATYTSNRVLRGTKVMEGHGVMRVTAVGDATESGQLYDAAQIDNSVKTPLNEQLDRLGKWISYASYAIGIAIVLGRVLTFMLSYEFELIHFVTYLLQTLMIAVTLVVVAVPEGLPMAITLSLAYSMRSMLKANNLVRKMHACETMGATTVICTDKTGTLTQNRMHVDGLQLYGSEELLCENIALNSTAELDTSTAVPMVLGNPTEGALLLWLRDRGGDYLGYRNAATIINEEQFTTERKYMASLVISAVTGKQIYYVKGAPEIVMAMCEPSEHDAEAVAQLAEWQDKGMRTLAFAYKEVEAINTDAVNDVPSGKLNFLAIVAIADPVRADVPEAIRESIAAGIQIKIVTGDTPRIAAEIGRQIGLINADDSADLDRYIITGPVFAALSDEEMLARISDLKIIARARPMDKKRLVEALQQLGEVVAVTGDGTNDAPALKAAHVGLSMGDGTAVAKGASAITIIDNSFASINRAVMWGRSLYQNIQRFLLFQLTVNVSACLIVLAGAFMGTESPLTVTQMLWVNLIMDTFGAMALASLPPSQRVMRDKPRDRRAFILGRDMSWNIAGVGVAFFVMLFVLLWIFQRADIQSMVDLWTVISTPFTGNATTSLTSSTEASVVTPYEQTLLFSIFVWTHFWYMFNARAFYTGRSIFGSRLSTGFLAIVAVIVIGQLFITEIAYEFFNCAPMLHGPHALPANTWSGLAPGLEDLLTIVVLSSAVLWIRELWSLVKYLFKK